MPGNDDERAILCAQRLASADGTQAGILCLLDAVRGSCSVASWARWLMNSLCCMRRNRSIFSDDEAIVRVLRGNKANRAREQIT